MNTKSNAKDLSPDRTLELTWNGHEWKVDCNIPAGRLRSGSSFTVEIPHDLFMPPGWRRLFKAGTTLYLRFEPTEKNAALEMKLKDYFKQRGRGYKDSREYLLYPILLKEAFYIRKEKSALIEPSDGAGERTAEVDEDVHQWSGCPCRCVLPVEEDAEREFPSLNQAVKHAVKRCTNAQGGFVNVFDRVLFDYKCGFLKIGWQRRALLHDKPLPAPKLKQDTLF